MNEITKIDFNNEKFSFNISNKYLNLINKLLYSLKDDKKKFEIFFINVFKNTEDLLNKKLENSINYFNNCKILKILEFITLINNNFDNYTNIVKIGKSKNNTKKNCIIDDSTIIDTKNNNIIRLANGTDEEPLRGIHMFNSFDDNKKNYIIESFYSNVFLLLNLIEDINNDRYIKFNPIQILQKIIIFLKKNKKYNLILELAWEIHDEPYKLSIDELITLFSNFEYINELWLNNFIDNNNGKFRIFLICWYCIKYNILI